MQLVNQNDINATPTNDEQFHIGDNYTKIITSLDDQSMCLHQFGQIQL